MTHSDEVLKHQSRLSSNNGELINELDHMNKAPHQLKLRKAQVEHEETVSLAISFEYANIRNLELYHIFCVFFNVRKFREL